MIQTSTTFDSTFQILDPIAVTLPGTNPLQYIESGYTNLPINQKVTTITFTVPKISSYDIIESDIVNVTDATPINFSYNITSQNSAGFTVDLSGLPDTSNYFLQWTVQVPPVPSTSISVIEGDVDGGGY